MRRITCTFVLLSAIVLGASLASAQAPTKLDHGASTTWFGHVPLMVAIDRGYFKEVGLDVELKPIVKSSDRMLALTQGGIQWTNTGVLSVIVEMAKGNDSFYWFANVDDSPGAEGLVVQPGINSIKDLKGKKIAVTLNSGAEITLYYVLKDAGLTLADVRVVPMASTEMVTTFTNKNIDAYCVWDPAFTDGQKAVPGSKVLATDKDTPIYRKFKTASAPDVVVIRKDLVDKHPETAKKLIAAYFKGVKLTKENPREAAVSADKWFKRGVDWAEAGIRKFAYFDASQQREHVDELLGNIEMVIGWAHDSKNIETKPDPRKWLRRDLVPAP
jgi:ABC-type nitrate/sulfonate/bicarbonate transport system substrate-binding protein